ncbi:hypothetical protein JDV02_005349 [Purpureocillium takamizusanense]|uniref:Uncharacterized protein n=1 Tax=Purpureocillium takamizusanense TaxID=2060973 RepID=A0A9Q8QH73_9HYPO|nr:uncharacterized protein JDV02_005349 [Purpureocillium takamizusanense]UNI19136.1 hypothetical protein JDV02_005349 [Purpureocillium takamizusanense]
MRFNLGVNDATQAFLAAHPDIAIGRDALHEAEAKFTSGNNFVVYSKPVANIILIKEYDADTKERRYTAALVDDPAAEAFYREHESKFAEDGPV